MSISDLVNTLNPMQRQAVELPPVSALILAGAGSGKTKVLTTRIAWLIAQGLARPSQILAVTFTNKAAREMRTRLESMITVDVSSLWMGTFHGICHKILRLHAEDAGLPKTFQIIDSGDQLSLVKRIMKDAGLDPEMYDPKAMTSAINGFKERGMRASAVGVGDTSETGVGIYRAYEGRCQREGLVDFAELLLRCVELLENNALLRDHYSDRFRFMLVDEFQDTNVLQFRWIRALAKADSKTNSVFCVGDDDQSIYAFRGARVGNMADFVKEYNVQNIVKLEQNYRSTSHILDAANAVIANNEGRMGKNLWTQAGSGELIGLYNAADDREEARSVTQEILTRHRMGTKWSNCAVLYRNNAQSRVIEQYFTANSLPYRIYGGLRFFDRAEVKDVTAYLRVMTNPDDTSVLRVINHPPRGIGATSLQRVAEAAAERNLSIWDAVNDWTGSPATVARVEPFVRLIKSMREACEGLNLADTVTEVMQRSGLKDFYDAQKDRDIRMENMLEVVNAAAGYCKENGIEDDCNAFDAVPGSNLSPVDGFLSQATLEADDKNEGEVQDAVQMMTVHASKGLEFDNVFLVGLEEKLFPHAARDGEDPGKALSEERRLMYVAMTRARKYLRISWCASRMLYGDRRSNLRSSFLDEVPEEHIKDLGGNAQMGEGGAGRAMSRAGMFGANGYARVEGSRSGGSYSRGGFSYNQTSDWIPAGADRPRYGSSSGSRSGYSSSSSRSSGPEISSSGSWKNTGVRKASEYLGSGSSGMATLKSKTRVPNQWDLYEGDKVVHEKFGAGVIERVNNPTDPDGATVRVKFQAGVKELLLAYAAPKMNKIG